MWEIFFQGHILSTAWDALTKKNPNNKRTQKKISLNNTTTITFSFCKTKITCIQKGN
jgi:hypothetical protein